MVVELLHAPDKPQGNLHMFGKQGPGVAGLSGLAQRLRVGMIVGEAGDLLGNPVTVPLHEKMIDVLNNLV